MKRIVKLAAAVVFVAVSAQAQTTTTPTDAYPVGGAQPAAAPQEIVKETHGDWEIRCTNAGKTCFMYQLMLNDKGAPVAELSMVKLPLGSAAVAGVTLVTPLGTLLTQGLTVQVDAGDATRYPFTWCTKPGCFSRFGLNDLSLGEMQKGQKIKVTLFSIRDAQTPVVVTASLKGFTDAFAALETPAK